jgi:uncharacterized protein YcaQ
MQLSQSAARALMIAALGLHSRPAGQPGKMDLLKMIKRMGALQIDTINVVARSPYLTLWSRLGDYQPQWLDELLAAGHLFEYWSHEACLLPIEDYPLYRHRMINPESLKWKYSRQWADDHKEELALVLAHIRARGPARSIHFTRKDKNQGGWWGWKPEKRALELLFTAGELMIAGRHNFQRIYDLRERILPDWHDEQLPSLVETERALALKAVRALGLTDARWVADYFRVAKQNTTRLVKSLAAEGALLTVQVEGWQEPAYLHPDNLKLAKQAAKGLQSELTTLLSPFDPLVWDRTRARELFNFDYRLECYTPAPKRRFGYFTLPILRRGALIGRIDPKAHRKEGVFEVKSLHLEAGVKISDELVADIAGALKDCANWHKTPKIIVRAANPSRLARSIQQAVDC